MKRFVNRLYSNQGGQLFFAAVLSAVCFAVLYSTHGIQWVIGDDADSMRILSGYFTGTPSFCAPFVNAFLGYAFQFLYGITTEISWYTFFHIIVIIFSVTVIFRLVFLCFNKKNISIIFPLVICPALFFAVFSNLAVYMVFTLTAATAGCAAIALLFIADINQINKLRIFDYILSAVFMLLSFLIRFETGEATFCFWALTVVYFAAKALVNSDKKSGVKKAVRLLVLMLAVFAIAFIGNSVDKKIKSANEADGFSEFSYYRARIADYNTVSWYTDKEFFESLGWNEDTYKLSKSWFFLDRHFNTEELMAIEERTQSGEVVVLTFKEKAYRLYTTMFNDKVGLAHSVTIFSLSVFVLLMFIASKEKRKKILLLLYSICTLGGFLILCFYLCFVKQRFLIHVYQIVSLPTIAALICAACSSLPNGFKFVVKKEKNAILLRLGCAVISLLCIGSAVSSLYKSYVYNPSLTRFNSEIMDSFEEYAENHSENFYIYEFGDDPRAWLTFDSEKKGKTNFMRCGGCLFYSNTYYDVLKQNGYTEFYSENLYDDNVYFAIRVNGIEDIVKMYSDYFNNNFGPTEMIEVYRNDYFAVFDINYKSAG